MNRYRVIKQIMPAPPGWRTVRFSEVDRPPETEIMEVPIIGWALMEYEDENTDYSTGVEPLTLGDFCYVQTWDGIIVAEENEDFHAILTPDMPYKEEDYRERADEWLQRRLRRKEEKRKTLQKKSPLSKFIEKRT